MLRGGALAPRRWHGRGAELTNRAATAERDDADGQPSQRVRSRVAMRAPVSKATQTTTKRISPRCPSCRMRQHDNMIKNLDAKRVSKARDCTCKSTVLDAGRCVAVRMVVRYDD